MVISILILVLHHGYIIHPTLDFVSHLGGFARGRHSARPGCAIPDPRLGGFSRGIREKKNNPLETESVGQNLDTVDYPPGLESTVTVTKEN